MAGFERCFEFGLPDGGFICLQMLSDCAGLYAALLQWALSPPRIYELTGGMSMPVFQWVSFCGPPCRPSSCWGMREVLVIHLVVLASRPYARWVQREDVPPHLSLHSLCALHVGRSPAMLYFHSRVKKRTSPLVDRARIQNFVVWQQLNGWAVSLLKKLGCTLLCARMMEVPRRESCIHVWWGSDIFDSTLGFPGEGPRWSIRSANVDSFATNYNCLQWDADVFLLQEARIADSNIAEVQRKAGMCNLSLFCSQPLQKQRASNGTFRVPSGGTATCSHREFTQLFDEKMDISGQWAQLRASARVTATWHQVSTGVKLLAFNFYGIANAASERAKFTRNNDLLHMIFMIAAQFGDIPILLGGDFQMEPGMYPAVQLALDHWGWSDPLLSTDAQGDVVRPTTFFQHSSALAGEGESSIDGILMNRTALTALIDIRVLDHRDRQHRPVQATFAWDRIQQVGSIMQRPAPLHLDHVQRCNPDDPGCPVNTLGEQVWHGYEGDFSAARTADAKWEVFNHFATQLLLLNGARWGAGPCVRGTQPTFHRVQVCAAQDASGNLASPRLHLLRASLRSLRELEHRFTRSTTSAGDLRTLRNTQQRLLRRLKVAKLLTFPSTTNFCTRSPSSSGNHSPGHCT